MQAKKKRNYLYSRDNNKNWTLGEEWDATPCTLLSEIAGKAGGLKSQLDYAFRQMTRETIEDNTHSQHIFECQCSFAGMITSGSNTKKKNAKHLASEYMLRSLQERGMVKGLRVPEKPFLGESDDNFDNPTSKLFEFVQIRGIEKPVFWDDMYGTQFKMTCTIASLKLESTGMCSSKKQAKREACRHMLEKLESCDVEGLMKEHELQQKLEEEDEENNYHRNKNTYMVETSNIHSFLGYRNQRGSYINIDGKDLYRLQATDKFLSVLNGICKRYCLLITHFEFKDLDVYGLKQTILRVNSIPPVTCFGKGFTKTDAKNASALQAIEHFNVGSRRMVFRERNYNRDDPDE